MEAYGLAQKVGRETGQPNAIWEAYAGLGALYAARKEVPAAIENYKKAIGIIEDLRVQLLLREYSSGFFKSKIPIYEALVDLLFEDSEKNPSAGALEECLYYAEKAKARSFLDDLQKARIDSSSLPRETVDELEQISRKISHLSAELNDGSLSPADRTGLQEQLGKAEDDYQLFTEKVRAAESRLFQGGLERALPPPGDPQEAPRRGDGDRRILRRRGEHLYLLHHRPGPFGPPARSSGEPKDRPSGGQLHRAVVVGRHHERGRRSRGPQALRRPHRRRRSGMSLRDQEPDLHSGPDALLPAFRSPRPRGAGRLRTGPRHASSWKTMGSPMPPPPRPW